MSYILDALKKAEAERDPDARAGLAIAAQSRRRNRTLTYGLVIALIVNAGVLLWLFFPEAALEKSASSEDQVSNAPQPVDSRLPTAGAVESAPSRADTAAAPASTPEAQPAPRNLPSESNSGDTFIRPGDIRPGDIRPGDIRPGDIRPGDIRSPSSQPANQSLNQSVSQPVPLSNLPADVRQRFPTLDFSTHIYADEADLRAVVVNGMRLEEGDRIEDVRVDEITEDGAVFEFEGRLVAVSVLDGWN